MKDWKDKALEDSFPKKTQEQEIEETEQKIKGFFGGSAFTGYRLSGISGSHCLDFFCRYSIPLI